MSPDEYPWSSYQVNAWGKLDPLVAPHQLFLAIHPDQVVREREYRELFRVNLSRQDIHAIHEALSANQILGEGRFK